VAAEKHSEIDDLLKPLDLQDDELEEVVVRADKAKEYQMAAGWAVAKVHTNRSFNADVPFGKMKAVWNLSRDPIYKEAAENLFVFHMHGLGDWNKVMHQGHWTLWLGCSHLGL
jgi:hypothetical protein